MLRATHSGCADRKWGRAYLTQDFFHRVGASLGDRVLLVVAYDDDLGGEMVAAALNFVGDTALYGRNWGCRPGADYKVRHDLKETPRCALTCHLVPVLPVSLLSIV